jgi:hypothetical protein
MFGLWFRLRKAIGNRDSSYTLERMIEFDVGYFTIISSEVEQERALELVKLWVNLM